MAEEMLFEEAGITVTRTLFTTPSKSVSIANIASVSKYKNVTETQTQVPKNRTAAIVLIVIGVLTLWVFLVGVIPLIIGIVLANRKDIKTSTSTLFEVQLESSGASSTAFESKDEALVERIVAAVRAAIAARG